MVPPMECRRPCNEGTCLLAVEHWPLPLLWSLSRSAVVTCWTLEASVRVEEPGRSAGTAFQIRALLVSPSVWANVLGKAEASESTTHGRVSSRSRDPKLGRSGSEGQPHPVPLEKGHWNQESLVCGLRHMSSVTIGSGQRRRLPVGRSQPSCDLRGWPGESWQRRSPAFLLG